MTVGPWKPIKLHSYTTKISDVDIRSQVSEALAVNVTVDVLLSGNNPGLASVVLKDPQGVRIADEAHIKVTSGYSRAEFGFTPGHLELWYPVGYGKQPLYTIEVEVTDEVSNSCDPASMTAKADNPMSQLPERLCARYENQEGFFQTSPSSPREAC